MFLDKVYSIWCDPDGYYRDRGNGLSVKQFLDKISGYKNGVTNFKSVKRKLYEESSKYDESELEKYNLLLSAFDSVDYAYSNGLVENNLTSIVEIMSLDTVKDNLDLPCIKPYDVIKLSPIDLAKTIGVVSDTAYFRGNLYSACCVSGETSIVVNPYTFESTVLRNSLIAIGDADFASKVITFLQSTELSESVLITSSKYKNELSAIKGDIKFV